MIAITYFKEINRVLSAVTASSNKSPRAQRRSPGYNVQRFKKIFKKLPIAEADKPNGRVIVTFIKPMRKRLEHFQKCP